MKTVLFTLIAVLLTASITLAHEQNFTEIEQLIDSGISCDKLTDEQLEEIGEYYMEQMHPGEEHEIMDSMMGGEGSAGLKQMHIQMARNIYCNENIMMGGMMIDGMMWGTSGLNTLTWLNQILLTVVLVLLIVLLYKLIMKK